MTKDLPSTGMLPIKINKTRVLSLIDSGSFYNLMSKETAYKLKIPTRIDKSSEAPTLFSANGTILQIIASADIVVCISTLRLPTTVYITQNLNENIILGR